MDPGFSKLKALIKSGLAGKPLVASLETHWNRGKEYYSKAWRGTWKGEQGGAILSHSIHIHDLITYDLWTCFKYILQSYQLG
jgi:predicted dehydrogenase